MSSIFFAIIILKKHFCTSCFRPVISSCINFSYFNTDTQSPPNCWFCTSCRIHCTDYHGSPGELPLSELTQISSDTKLHLLPAANPLCLSLLDGKPADDPERVRRHSDHIWTLLWCGSRQQWRGWKCKRCGGGHGACHLHPAVGACIMGVLTAARQQYNTFCLLKQCNITPYMKPLS